MNFLKVVTDSDYERYARTFNAVMPPPPVTGPEMKSRDARKSTPSARFIVEQEGDDVAVAGFSQSEFGTDKHRFFTFVFVREDRLGQGIATFAQERLLQTLEPYAPSVLEATCRESNPAGLAFLAEQGFFETMREWESVLDVPSFDSARFAGARERPESAGVRLTTLAAEEARLGQEPARKRLWELDAAVGPDVPSDEPEVTPPFDEWQKLLLGGPSFRPESFFIAVAPDDSYAGVSMLYHREATPELSTGLTGVRREWRRHGIALALKLLAIEHARKLGAPKIRTENATTNRPMLSINEALGFEKEPAWVLHKRELMK
jgi:mycothiol synthase